MEIILILLALLYIGIMSKWEKYSIEKRYERHKEEKIRRGLYYDRTKL